MLAVVVANVILAAVALGVPAYRGHLQAQASHAAFEGFIACLYGAEPGGEGGLALPPGSEERFASQVLNAPPDWPRTCEAHLNHVAPAEATFVFPSIKRTGADLRAVVEMLREGVRGLAAEREQGLGAVPERPLWMVEKLRAAMTLLSQAAGTDDHIHENAIRFVKAAQVESPARLPIAGREDGALTLWETPTGIEAISVDRVGLSWLSLDDGRVDRRRARRSSLVRGVVTIDREPFVVWATPEHRCAEQEDRCARRATGIAPFDRGSDVLPEPTWLAGHPNGRLDRSVYVHGRSVWLLARDTPVALRRFELPELQVDKAPPLSGEVVLSAPGEGELVDALLLSHDPPLVLFSERAEDGRLRSTLVSSTGRTELPEVVGPGAWSKVSGPCPGGGRALAYGTEQHLRLGVLDDEGGFMPSPPIAAPLAPVLDRDGPQRDRMRVLCAPSATHLAYLDADHQLWRRSCTRSGDCGPAESVATAVHDFDAVLRDQQPVLAAAGDHKHQQIRVFVPASPSPLVPAPCWEPRRGLCGVPTLVSDGPRLLLAARERGDVLLMEANADGTGFRTMAGVKVGSAVQTDASAPMDQHLIRKGLKSAHE